MPELQGQCMCGAVTVTATPAQNALGACHCDQCRRWTSSMLVTFEAEEGYAALGSVKTFASSDWAERAFCAECGSVLWYRITTEGEMHGQTLMAAGLFPDTGHGLTHELFIDKKPQGYAFAGERQQMTKAEVEAMFAPLEEGDSQ
ncbi:GFA family protein [Ruegeria sp. HU-ET01832]|uniref:GFA family protein n=1 Tax=Ruegeria sp. HU-ET01832 TaxID=3135906 RepID=UPI00310659F7